MHALLLFLSLLKSIYLLAHLRSFNFCSHAYILCVPEVMYRWVSLTWFIPAHEVIGRKCVCFYGGSMGIRPLWTVENLWEITRIHYLRDCVLSRPISCRFARRAEAQQRSIKIRTCQPRVDARFFAYVFSQVYSFQSRVSLFCDCTFRKLRYCTRWNWKKKKEIYVGSACSSSKYMKRALCSLNEHSLLHFIASQYLGKITQNKNND